MTDKEIKESKRKAFEQIKEFLRVNDVDGQFAKRSGDYYSNEKFIVTWNANYKGMLCEYGIDKCDAAYEALSGYKAIYSVRNFFLEKQIKGFSSIERGLLEVGLALCPKKEKKDFFDTFVETYNLKQKIKQHEPK
jgi:hypothetical protein